MKKRKWEDHNWTEIESNVYDLQRNIYVCSKEENHLGVKPKTRALQKAIIGNYDCKVLAVRKVTQDNRGKAILK